MGGPDGSEYLMLQLHYDNPKMISGVCAYTIMYCNVGTYYVIH